MQLRVHSSQRGDTLVEVLLATAILAFLVAGTSVIMNSSLSRTQVSLERTQVQAAMQGQASILRALRDAAVKEQSAEAGPKWEQIVSYAMDPNPAAQTAICTVGGGGTRFYFNDTSTSGTSSWLQSIPLGPITNEAQALPSGGAILPTPGDGLWIEVYKGRSGAVQYPYYDFYIKSCWQNIGSGPKQELKTVVRLHGSLE